MTTTLTLDFRTDTGLSELEHELKQIPGLTVFLVEPEDNTAPVLLSLGIDRKDEQAHLTIRRITHLVYDFLHGSAQENGAQPVTLVTIEGESVDITSLSSDEIKQIITEAYAGQAF